MPDHLQKVIDQFIRILVERGGIGLVSGIFIFGAGLFLRLNYIDFPNLAPWEVEAYGFLSFVAMATGLFVAAIAGIRYVLARGVRAPLQERK